MTLTERFSRLNEAKFSFGKNTEYAEQFAKACGAFSMYDNGFGLGIPSTMSNENQLWAVFNLISAVNGIFLFNVSGVNMIRAKKGFEVFTEAEENNEITEWEFSIILENNDYRKSCIFHNGKVAFKKRILWNSIQA